MKIISIFSALIRSFKTFYRVLKSSKNPKSNETLSPLKLKHARAENYKHLCRLSGKIAVNFEKKGLLDKIVYEGYKVIAAEHDKRTNFKAVTYQKGNTLINCFTGTDTKSLKDQKANLLMGFGKPTGQIHKAKLYTENIIKKYGDKAKIINAGHSEGGTEAICAGLTFGLEVFTYNAFTPGKKLLHKVLKRNSTKNHENLISNYRTAHDLISKLFNDDIGKTYIVESLEKFCLKRLILSLRKAHALEIMGNCKNAIPLEVYQKSHPKFVDKLKLTGKTIG